MTLPNLTTKQQEIIRLLYRHRFLDRTHIQALLHHKDKRRIISWLKDLREKQYIAWMYDGNDFALKTKPAVYYLGLNGIRFLRGLNEYPPEELRKRYKETSRQQPFIDRCLLLADCCITLKAKSAGDIQYSYVLEADYTDPNNEYYFLDELKPQLCFMKQDGKTTANYLIEIFDTTTPRYMVKKRLNDYVNFLDNGDWERETGDEEPPIVLFACPTVAELAYCKRRTRKVLEDKGLRDDERMRIRFATVEKVKTLGVTGMIWEEI